MTFGELFFFFLPSNLKNSTSQYFFPIMEMGTGLDNQELHANLKQKDGTKIK